MWSPWEAATTASPAHATWPNQASPWGRSSAAACADPTRLLRRQLHEHRRPIPPQARRSSAARHPRTVHAQRRRLVRPMVRDRYTPGSGYVLLHHVFDELNAKGSVWGHAPGGPAIARLHGSRVRGCATFGNGRALPSWKCSFHRRNSQLSRQREPTLPHPSVSIFPTNSRAVATGIRNASVQQTSSSRQSSRTRPIFAPASSVTRP